MDKIKKHLYIIIILFAFLPILCNAATELGASTQSPVTGSNIYVQLDANYGDKLKIRDFHVIITYNPDYLEFDTITWIQSRGTYRHEPGKITIDKDPGINWESGATLQMKFKVKRTGLTKVDVLRNGDSHYDSNCDKGCDIIGQSFAGVSINAIEPSSQTLIGTLYVKGYTMLPTFSKTNFSYNLTVPPDVNYIDIVATKSDSRQTLSGYGVQKLAYGNNIFYITVTAQNGATQTYEINVNRTDNRTGDTTLKSLYVSGTNLRYEENKNVYEATVSKSVESVLINARPNDPNATVIGTGTKELNIGKNTFSISVASSAGRISNYTIIINRSTEKFQTFEKSSKLRTIKVNNLVLDISDDKKSWLYGIGKDYDSLTIDTITESSTALVEIEGNENLKSGLNVITIKVIEPNESEDEDAEDDITEYYLIVYKNPTNATLINDINNVTEKTDIIYNTTENDTHIIPLTTLKNIKNNNSKLYYNVVNFYNGILYQAIISENTPNSNLNASFKKISDGPLTFQTELPEGTEMLVYLGDYFDDEANVKIYTYNENEEYTLLTDGITLQNGYISFVANGKNNYVFSLASLIKEKSPLEQFLANNKKYLIGTICIVVFIIIISILLNKIKRQKNDNEPLY